MPVEVEEVQELLIVVEVLELIKAAAATIAVLFDLSFSKPSCLHERYIDEAIVIEDNIIIHFIFYSWCLTILLNINILRGVY